MTNQFNCSYKNCQTQRMKMIFIRNAFLGVSQVCVRGLFKCDHYKTNNSAYRGSGGLKVGGSIHLNYFQRVTGSGGLLLAGTAPNNLNGASVYSNTGSGGILIAGTAPNSTNTHNYSNTGSGGILVAGLATDSIVARSPIVGSGGMLIGGTSTVAYFPAAGDTPLNLSVLNVDDTTNGLIWDRVNDNDTAVIIERAIGGGGYSDFVTLPAHENCYFDRSGFPNTTYHYKVKVDTGTVSPATSSVSATTSTVIELNSKVPVIASVVSQSPSTCLVTITNNTWIGDDEQNGAPAGLNYLVERSEDGLLWKPRHVLLYYFGNTFTDTELTAGATYYYRARASYNAGFSSPCSAVSVTQPTIAGNVPVEPTNLVSEAAGTTSIDLTWDGPTGCTFEVYRANTFNANATDPIAGNTFTLVHTTSLNVTNYTDVGLNPASVYAYRIRSVKGSEVSDYTPCSGITYATNSGQRTKWYTNTTMNVGGNTYDIGPGKTYTTLGAFDWTTLGPGDTVNIHYKTGGYAEAILLSCKGLKNNWITIQGIPDGSGNKPFLTGVDATILDPTGLGIFSGTNLISISKDRRLAAGIVPGYVAVKGLEVRKCYHDYQYNDGTNHVWSWFSVAINVADCDTEALIENCTIDNNVNGIFAKAHCDLTIRSCVFYNNGVDYVSAAPEAPAAAHHSYCEVNKAIYEYNWYDQVRANSGGAGVKDRSVEPVVRYNQFWQTGTPIQTPEAQDLAFFAYPLPEYRKAVIYGNVIFQTEGESDVPPIWYNSDQQNTPLTRAGIAYVYNNTFVWKSTNTARTIFNLGHKNGAIDARNNIFYAMPVVDTDTAASQFLCRIPDGDGETPHFMYFGNNWISPSYYPSNDNGGIVTGIFQGLSRLHSTSGVNPGFIDPYIGDYRPKSPGAYVDPISDAIAGTVTTYPVNKQYSDPETFLARTSLGNSLDYGAIEYNIDPNPLPDPDDVHRIIPPTLDLSVDNDVPHAGNVINFTATVGGYPTPTLTWDLDGDGTEDDSTSTTPSWSYDDEGIVTVTCTATNSEGSLQKSIEITVEPAEVATDRSDNFNRADSVTLGTPSDGLSDWNNPSGIGQILNNKVSATFSSGSNVPFWLDCGASDVSIQATAVNLWDRSGIACRVSDLNNFVAFVIGWSGVVSGNAPPKIVRYQAGVPTTLVTCNTNVDPGDVVKLTAIGDEVRAYKNGTLIGTATGVTFNQSLTSHGLFLSNPIEREVWDDFSINATNPSF